MPERVSHADIAIAKEDIQMTLGIQADVDVHSGHLDRFQYEGLTAKSVGAIPELDRDCSYFAGIPQREAQRMVGLLE